LKNQFVLALAILVAVVGCRPVEPTAPSKNSVAAQLPTLQGTPLHTGPHKTPKGMRGLTIVGYNYTDTYIDSFAVNGSGGGNLEVSEGVSGGGKGTCCAPIGDDMALPIKVEIAWKRDGDAPKCRQTVLLDGAVAKQPNNFEVHFFQDGTIQLAITDSLSPARVKLARFNPAFRHASGNTDNDIKYSECKRG
jgi:Protein of unknown function (DUF3304)